jgi:hypothetical protein
MIPRFEKNHSLSMPIIVDAAMESIMEKCQVWEFLEAKKF